MRAAARPAAGAAAAGAAAAGLAAACSRAAVGSVTPTADAVTLREHHTFAELPDGNYKPRLDDPRSGFGALQYADYAAPITTPLVQRFTRRHRLEKVDPTARVSEAKKPIKYYVDRGTPEPTRTALLEGARWWNQAFEAAGYRNAFQVELLPEGADPMDIRYNMINWVHRSTRGWSTGASLSDPRTGEIIKATVTLGSLRDRQDYLIFEGLLAPYKNGTETPAILAQTAMARIRQLAAHEVGHTLGIGHQYYNSTKGRISVMDYPHPLEKLNADGTIDLGDAYAVGIGEWDKVAIAFGYQDFPAGTDEPAALKKIVDDAWKADLIYMSNQDTDASPRVDQWNNGTDMAAELTRIMAVRRAALNRFDETVIKKDAPMATMEEALVPLYMYHRYAIESAASAIGGQDYIYAFRGDDRIPTKWVSAAQQRAALTALVHEPVARGAGAAEERAPEDPAASVGLGHASGAVHALHRRGVRPDQPGVGRGRRHHRLHPDARSRRPDGGAARDRPDAAGARRRHRRRCARRRSTPPRPARTSTKSAAPPRACWSTRVMALASGSPMPQVRAIASAALSTISGNRFSVNAGAGRHGGRRR